MRSNRTGHPPQEAPLKCLPCPLYKSGQELLAEGCQPVQTIIGEPDTNGPTNAGRVFGIEREAKDRARSRGPEVRKSQISFLLRVPVP